MFCGWVVSCTCVLGQWKKLKHPLRCRGGWEHCRRPGEGGVEVHGEKGGMTAPLGD